MCHQHIKRELGTAETLTSIRPGRIADGVTRMKELNWLVIICTNKCIQTSCPSSVTDCLDHRGYLLTWCQKKASQRPREANNEMPLIQIVEDQDVGRRNWRNNESQSSTVSIADRARTTSRRDKTRTEAAVRPIEMRNRRLLRRKTKSMYGRDTMDRG